MERKFDLDERLIDFAAQVIRVSQALPKTIAATHLAGQLVRSCTSLLSIMAKPKVRNPETILFIK